MNRTTITYLIILMSLICLFFSIKLNFETYRAYIQSTGKTRALFGLTELKYSYKYYLGILSLIGFIISVNYLRKEKNRALVVIAMLISIFAVFFSFFEMWKIFV